MKTENDYFKFGQILELRPLYGKKKKIVIQRTGIQILNQAFGGNAQTWDISLECLAGTGKGLNLVLCQDKFILSSMDENFFILNGSYVLSAVLCQGDRVEWGGHCFDFLTRDSEHNNSLLPAHFKLVSKQMLPVLLVGETGVGKSRLAKKIHEESKLSGPFVAVNISSFSQSLVESEIFGHVKGAFTGASQDKLGAILEADSGTLFLDEIDSLSVELQTKLLLFLESKSFRPVGHQGEKNSNVRLIFASGQRLERLVNAGVMRKDFYFRLKMGVEWELPSLKGRVDLIKAALEDFETKYDVIVSNKLRQYYYKCPWPGNYRQLYSHLTKKMVLTRFRKLEWDEMDEALKWHPPVFQCSDKINSLDEIKKKYALSVFERTQDYFSAAKILKIHQKTLRSWVTSSQVSK